MLNNKKLGLFLPWVLAATLVVLVVLALQVTAVRSQGLSEHEREINEATAAATAAQQTGSAVRQIQSVTQNDIFPLFIGVDDANISSTYTIDPATNISATAFSGGAVWGAAYDPLNDRVLFNDGSVLYEWPVGGAVNSLGSIVDASSNGVVMVSLGFYDGQLYGTNNTGNEAVWAIDVDTLVATVAIDYADAEYDFGGLEIDPDTGIFYGTNDTDIPHGRGLFQINLDGTATKIAPYPAGETDIDGLAIGEGRAYLVTDEPGEIYVYDLDAGIYIEPLKNPWTTSEIFSGAAWISSAGSPKIEVELATITAVVTIDATITQVMTISNVGGSTLQWEIVEEAAAPGALRERGAMPTGPLPEHVPGSHPPSTGAAPIVANNVTPSKVLQPELTSEALRLVRSWRASSFFTIFNPDTPQFLPTTKVFTGTGAFIGAGEFINGLSYMIDNDENLFVVDDSGTLQDQYKVTEPPAGENYVGMALDPTTGAVYASSTNLSASSLFTLDPLSGDAVWVGPISGSPANIALSFDGAGNLFGYDIISNTFMQIDPATGNTSNIVPLPFDANFGQGMLYDPVSGLLIMLAFNNTSFQGELWTVSTADPAAPVFEFIGALGSSVPGGSNQLTWGGTESCSAADIPWVSVQPGSGAISAGASESVDVIFDASGLEPGVYTGTLCIRSNDSSNSLRRVQLSMTVELPPPPPTYNLFLSVMVSP